MKKILNFSNRNLKEIMRDPISLVFSLGLPLFLLFIFQQFKIPSEVYSIENFTPGIIIFGFSFITLFTASLVANDRSSSLLARLKASPMKPHEYILGYIFSLLPMVLIQNLLFFITAILLGLPFNINVILTILVSILLSIMYIALGIIIGCITTARSAGGVSSIIVQLVAFTSGMYFSSEMVGKVFDIICKILPFSSGLDIIKVVLNKTQNDNLLLCILVVLIYTVITTIIASILFRKKMVNDNK